MSPVNDQVRDLRADAVDRLTAAGIANPDNDVAWLLAAAAGVDRKALPTVTSLDTAQAATFQASLSRREVREPLQHIVGWAGFRQLTIKVGPGVFVPRPETELLVELALRRIVTARMTPNDRLTVVDLCTGSAAVPLALATEATQLDVVAVESEPPAVQWAERNIADHEAQLRTTGSSVELVAADAGGVADGSLAHLRGQVDVLTCNPPYIPDDSIPRDREVREFDPPAALYGGPDGLDVVRRVVEAAAKLLKSGGALLIEHGDTQGDDAGALGVPALLRSSKAFTNIQDQPDLTNRPRVTTAARASAVAGLIRHGH